MRFHLIMHQTTGINIILFQFSISKNRECMRTVKYACLAHPCRALPSTVSKAEHSATPAAFVALQVKMPESSGKISLMTRKHFWPSFKIWKSSLCVIWWPSRNQDTSGDGVPVTVASNTACWPSTTFRLVRGTVNAGGSVALVRSCSGSLLNAVSGFIA